MQQSEVHSKGPRCTQLTLSKINNDAVADAILVILSELLNPMLPSVDFIPFDNIEPIPDVSHGIHFPLLFHAVIISQVQQEQLGLPQQREANKRIAHAGCVCSSKPLRWIHAIASFSNVIYGFFCFSLYRVDASSVNLRANASLSCR